MGFYGMSLRKLYKLIIIVMMIINYAYNFIGKRPLNELFALQTNYEAAVSTCSTK